MKFSFRCGWNLLHRPADWPAYCHGFSRHTGLSLDEPVNTLGEPPDTFPCLVRSQIAEHDEHDNTVSIFTQSLPVSEALALLKAGGYLAGDDIAVAPKPRGRQPRELPRPGPRPQPQRIPPKALPAVVNTAQPQSQAELDRWLDGSIAGALGSKLANAATQLVAEERQSYREFCRSVLANLLSVVGVLIESHQTTEEAYASRYSANLAVVDRWEQDDKLRRSKAVPGGRTVMGDGNPTA